MQFTLTRKLQVLYVLTLLIAGTVMLYFEGFRDMPVALEASQPDSLQYGAEIAADLFTRVFVYLSTRLMRMPRVQKSIAASPSCYAQWAYLRWAMLAAIIFVGLAVRYVFHSPATLGCPIIGALAMCFVWPTEKRKEHFS